jgi:hypothetical protein
MPSGVSRQERALTSRTPASGGCLPEGVEVMRLLFPTRASLLGLSLLLLGVIAWTAHGKLSAPRQYYSSYVKHPRQNYSYRTYYYKPTPTYVGYKHHYAIYHHSRPKHIYFYNPYKKQYWGRCPVNTEGKGQYSLLAEKHRKSSLEAIDEESFPPPGDMPPIPDSKDGEKMDLPPDDVPEGGGIPIK